LSSHQGAVLLFDTASGAPKALIDARELTAIRTAAATAAATDILAPKNAQSLALFGYGEQATSHLEAISLVRDIKRTFVWGRDSGKAAAFARANAAHGVVTALASAQEAAEASILCLTTGAADPYFKGAWLRAGHHLNAVGSSVASTSEVDSEAVARARYYVDFEDSARALAGDFKRALDAGAVTADHMLGSIGDVLTGAAQGRTSPDDITFFKSLGMVAEDLVAADFILAQAQAQDRGVLVKW
jgi:ornithine cyclodeaminase